jgi:SAM-dependent methyltransferase
LSKVLPFPIYNRAVAIEAMFSKARVKALYREEMYREYMSIKPYLPQTCFRVLDIGCGVAGLDFFIHQHYRTNPVELHLLDKSQVEPHVYYMFERKGAFYNSLAVAKSVLTGSGIDGKCVHLIEATDDEVKLPQEMDLVMSLLSWGFPVRPGSTLRTDQLSREFRRWNSEACALCGAGSLDRSLGIHASGWEDGRAAGDHGAPSHGGRGSRLS